MVKADYWNVSDEEVVEKTGKPLAHWMKALKAFDAGNSSVSVSSSRAAGRASPKTGAAGMERRSTAGITDRCQASWSWESSSDGGSRGGVGSAVSSGTDPSGSVAGGGGAGAAGPRCSSSSSR